MCGGWIAHAVCCLNRAQKEEKLETSLAKLRATWSDIVWQTAAGSRGVPTVKLSDNDVEVLEDNQVLVQVWLLTWLFCRYTKCIQHLVNTKSTPGHESSFHRA